MVATPDANPPERFKPPPAADRVRVVPSITQVDSTAAVAESWKVNIPLAVEPLKTIPSVSDTVPVASGRVIVRSAVGSVTAMVVS